MQSQISNNVAKYCIWNKSSDKFLIDWSNLFFPQINYNKQKSNNCYKAEKNLIVKYKLYQKAGHIKIVHKQMHPQTGAKKWDRKQKKKRQKSGPNNEKNRTLTTKRQGINWTAKNYISIKGEPCIKWKILKVNNLRHKCQRGMVSMHFSIKAKKEQYTYFFLALALALPVFFLCTTKKCWIISGLLEPSFFFFFKKKEGRSSNQGGEQDNNNIHKPEWAQTFT